MSQDVQDPAAPDETAPAATLRQFVTFHVARETYAVPLAEVQEIIRLPEMVDVPLAPPSLAGLANLRGSVLPIASLRRLFALADQAHDDATRVVVVSQGNAFGFVVDRMASVISAEPAEIEGTDGLATTEADLLTGVIKRPGGMVMIIDLGRLLQRSSAGRGPAARRIDGPPEAGFAASGDGREAVVSDEIQLVSFELSGQEYALPIAHVQEIVQVPEAVSELPNAEAHVIGVINLRDRLLPLVSLRTLFGLPPAALGEQSRIVVVSWGGAAGSVGIVTDTVKEVLRVARAIVDPLPDLLAGGGSLREVEAICRIDDGKRLVSILSAERLFATTNLNVGRAGEGTMRESRSETGAGLADEEEQFVVFRLAGEEYGVPIDAVHEIVRVPEELTRVPRTPAFIEGVVNLRGAVLPVIDQRRRFQLPDAERNDRQRIMVFAIAGVRTGFIVDSVLEVLRIPRTAIVPAPDLARDDDHAVTRVANLAAAKRIILMVDVDRLLSRHEVADLRAA